MPRTHYIMLCVCVYVFVVFFSSPETKAEEEEGRIERKTVSPLNGVVADGGVW